MLLYSSKVDHRDGTAIKSQWSIPLEDEEQAFVRSCGEGWIVGDHGWGLHLVEELPTFLGFGSRRRGRDGVQLFIARFDEGTAREWHGYPADPQFNNQDIPTEPVLSHWVSRAYITLAQKRRIMKAQPCVL